MLPAGAVLLAPPRSLSEAVTYLLFVIRDHYMLEFQSCPLTRHHPSTSSRWVP